MSFIYLASTYSVRKPDPQELDWRVMQARAAAAHLMVKGHTVFSPVAHCHEISDYMPEKLRFNHDFWMNQDLAILRHCKKLVVLMLPHWQESQGIGREVAAAKAMGIPVEYMQWPV